MKTFEELQRGLAGALALNRPESSQAHVLVALPSFSVGESLLSHYAERISALEHRYLLAQLVLHRIESCEMAFVSCQAPSAEVIDYYLSLVPRERRHSARRRFRVVEVPDRSARAVAAKLLDRPDLLDDLRASFAGRPAFIEPWNVTAAEVEVARRLEIPINGTDPALWPLGFKSAGRRLFAEAGVPIAYGREDIRTAEAVLDAIAAIRTARPTAAAVVVKHDNSGAGDGNVVIDLRDPAGVAAAVAGLPGWYLRDLTEGGVVEELVSGTRFTSPSAQIDLSPTGEVSVLATHEQVLGGAGAQVYMGCRFPADEAYAGCLAEHARAVGRCLAERGAVGRVSVDFAAARDAGGRWEIVALEMNLRKGGTTHPYAALRNLVPGRYDEARGRWFADSDGSQRAYWSTDNLVDPAWIGAPPAAVIGALADRGLQFDPERGVGVVLHMLAGLAIDGRVGMTAIGRSPEHASDLYEEAAIAVSRAAARSAPSS